MHVDVLDRFSLGNELDNLTNNGNLDLFDDGNFDLLNFDVLDFDRDWNLYFLYDFYFFDDRNLLDFCLNDDLLDGYLLYNFYFLDKGYWFWDIYFLDLVDYFRL